MKIVFLSAEMACPFPSIHQDTWRRHWFLANGSRSHFLRGRWEIKGHVSVLQLGVTTQSIKGYS